MEVSVEWGRLSAIPPLGRTYETQGWKIRLAHLEERRHSGMAAIVGLLMAKLSAGDEIVFFDQCYHRSREFCFKHLSRFGVVTHQVPTGDFDAMEAAINDRNADAGQRVADQPASDVHRLGTVRCTWKIARS